VFCKESKSITANPVVCSQSNPAVTATYIEIALRGLAQNQICLVLYKYGEGGTETIKSVPLLNILLHLNIQLPAP